MIVGIAEKSGVRDHDCLKSLIPEGRMVTEPDGRKDLFVERNPYNRRSHRVLCAPQVRYLLKTIGYNRRFYSEIKI